MAITEIAFARQLVGYTNSFVLAWFFRALILRRLAGVTFPSNFTRAYCFAVLFRASSSVLAGIGVAFWWGRCAQIPSISVYTSAFGLVCVHGASPLVLARIRRA